MDYEPSNILQYIFEKIFNQSTLNCKELDHVPFDQIKHRTFDNDKVHQLISKLSSRPIQNIKKYLSNKKFQEKFLFGKLKKKINVCILLDDTPQLKELLELGAEGDNRSLGWCVLNQRFEMLKLLAGSKPLDPSLLINAVGSNHDQMYFYLREQGLVPNVSIFNRAVGSTIGIVQDISQYIGASDKTIELGFEANQTEIILFLIRDRPKINPNLVTYAILNANFELVYYMEENKMFSWHPQLFYPALLSGSMKMVSHIEANMPNIHQSYILDTAHCHKGRSSLLLPDMMYQKNGRQYFSHTINYAIQSGSMEILSYVQLLGYGITPSNFITCIKQGTTQMLEFLAGCFDQNLPFYLIHYLGTTSYISSKMKKARILITKGLLPITPDKMDLDDYRSESAHLKMIEGTEVIAEDTFDVDYLMQYYLFFAPPTGFKPNYRLGARIKLGLALDLDCTQFLVENLSSMDQQLVLDSLFLFGNIDQIKRFYPAIPKEWTHEPSIEVTSELISYAQLNKLCFLQSRGLLKGHWGPLVTTLADPLLDLFFQKFHPMSMEPKLEYVIESGIKSRIEAFLAKNAFYERDLTLDIAKCLVLMADAELIQKFNLCKSWYPILSEFAAECDLVHIRKIFM